MQNSGSIFFLLKGDSSSCLSPFYVIMFVRVFSEFCDSVLVGMCCIKCRGLTHQIVVRHKSGKLYHPHVLSMTPMFFQQIMPLVRGASFRARIEQSLRMIYSCRVSLFHETKLHSENGMK